MNAATNQGNAGVSIENDPVACGKHSIVLCMVLQRTVARFCVGLHILRYVPLCAYSVG